MFEQERLIGRLQRSVTQEPDIVACFLSGSFGRRADDAYSDLDLVLVYGDKNARDRAWGSRLQFTQSIMPYVPFKSFDAAHIRPFFHVVLFANGGKLDLRFETQSSLTPKPLGQSNTHLEGHGRLGALLSSNLRTAGLSPTRYNQQGVNNVRPALLGNVLGHTASVGPRRHGQAFSHISGTPALFTSPAAASAASVCTDQDKPDSRCLWPGCQGNSQTYGVIARIVPLCQIGRRHSIPPSVFP